MAETTKQEQSKSPVSTINEYAQLKQIEPIYKFTELEGEPHCPRYRCTLEWEEKEFTGDGNSKKEAKRNAASRGVSELFQGTSPPKSIPKKIPPRLVEYFSNMADDLEWDEDTTYVQSVGLLTCKPSPSPEEDLFLDD